MAGSKSDRVLNARYDIFASNQNDNDSVRVGYIDSKRGYISGLSVYEANRYAEKNPGTQFIIATREEVRYLNITEVNKLTNQSILPKNRPSGIVDNNDELDPCNTVRGFATDPNSEPRGDLDGNEPVVNPPVFGGGQYDASFNYKKYKKDRTRIELQGGGGIGALASPIIGRDGSIIHCRVIDGGFGYQFPPQVRIFDENMRGAGARAYSLLGTTGYTQENYDDEDDVEEYNFDLGEYNFDSKDASWGNVYSLESQTVVGEWNPANIISLTNPQGGFASELTRYLEFLKGYDPNKPWWTTRDETPVRVSGNNKDKKANKLGAVLFPVKHHAWGGDRTLDDLFVDVEFEVYGQGTYKNRNLYFKFEAEDGSHSFRIRGIAKKENNSKKRTQIASVKANTNYVVTSNVRKRIIENSDEMVLEQGIAKQFGGTKEDGLKQRDGSKSKIIFADVVGSANDNDDIQVRSNIGGFKAGDRTKVKFDDAGVQNTEKLETIKGNKNNRYKRGTFDLTYRINRRKDKTFTTEITDSFMNKYAVSPEIPSNVEGTDRAGIPYSFIYKEFFPHEGEYIFRGASDNIGEVLLDGRSVMNISNTFKDRPVKKKVNVTEGLHEIRIDLLNTIQKKIVTTTLAQSQSVETKIIKGERGYPIRLASPGTKGRGEFAAIGKVSDKKIEYLDEDGDDPNGKLKIKSTSPGVSAKFSRDGSELKVKGDGDVTIEFQWDDDPKKYGKAVGELKIGSGDKVSATFRQKGEKGKETKTFKVTGTTKTEEVTLDAGLVQTKTGGSTEKTDDVISDIFDTKKYIKKANRSLYKTKISKFGNFFSEYAVTPFNPLEVDPEIIDVKPIESPAPVEKPKVKFERRGGPNGDLFMKVIGSGRARIGFKLKVDDSLTTSGLAVRDIKIESDSGNVNLKRDITERQNFRAGTGTILSGREKEKIKGSGEFTGGKTYKVIASGGSSTSGFKTVDNTIVFDDDYTNGWDKNAGLEIDFITQLDQPKSKPARQPVKDGKNNPSKNVSLDNVEGSADAYAGTHEIIWTNINFPYDGIYNVDVQVDDNARIEIFNDKFQAKKIDVKGFSSKGKNSLQSFTLDIKKGKYTIKAFLVQIPGKSIIDGNPMGLAIKIKTAFATITEEIIINKSWNQNPFGAALIINAPPPPIPQEEVLEQEGPCPPNPIWTTRSTGFVDQWYPCSHRRPGGGKTWSKFMNRYAMSPVLPIGSQGSGYSGQQWTNTWTTRIPFTGFYNFKATSDNNSSCIISQTPVDGGTSEVSQDRSVEVGKINHFGTEKKNLTSNKIFLEKGEAKIEITVQNGERIKYREVTRKVFNTSDWLSKPVKKDKDRIPVDFKVYGQGSKSSIEIKAIFKEKGGDHTFTIGNVEKSNTTESVKKRVKSNTDYKVTFVPTSAPITEKKYQISYDGLNSANNPIDVSGSGKTIKLKDGDDNDTNASFRIMSDSPGVSARFSSDGKSLDVKGNGDVTLRLEWDDNPNTAGVAVKSISVGGKTWRQSGRRGDQTETITTSGAGGTLGSGILEQGCMSEGFGKVNVKKEGSGQTDPSDIIFADYVRSSNDNNDMMIKCASGIFTPSNKTRTKSDVRRGKKVRRGTWDLTYRLDEAVFEVLEPITEVDGATYEIKNKELSRTATIAGSTTNSIIVENTDNIILNPTLATYNRSILGRLLSPFFPRGRNESGENLQGRTWEMVWEDVKFPIDGEYKFETEVDDTLKIEVSEDRVELNSNASMTTKKNVKYKTIRTASATNSRTGVKTTNATIKSGKRNVKLTLQNLKILGTSFKNNPTAAACKITCKEPVEIADQRPWLVNPVGVSAVLISPPCDRIVGGGGTVTEVRIIEEGNSYPPPEGPGIPSQVLITDIIPDTTPGIIGDTIELVGIGTFPVTKGPFGTIIAVNIPAEGIPITETPNIIPPGTPVTKLIPDTPTADPDTVIQITDLAGLKQTGYIEGRAYYGEVFFKDGTPFAGRYETAGRLIQVYATLQESIDAEVTTRPSAIQRSGTDVNSNNPRLNIPGTPDNLA